MVDPESTYLVSPDFNPEVIPEGYNWNETAFQELVKATDKATADQTIYTYGGPQGGSDVDYLNAADLTISDEKYNGEGQVVDTTITANAFNNAGTVTTEGTIAFAVKSFTNFGEFNLDKNGALTATSAVTNMADGTINLNAGSTLQGSTVVNGGTITVVSDHAAINGAISNHGTIDALMKKLTVTGDIQNANADDTKLARDATVITAREFEVTGNLLNYGSIGIENKPVHTVSVTGGALSNYHQLLVDVLTADSILNDSIQSEVEEKRTRGYIDAGEINAGSINNVSGTIKTHVSKEGAVGINVTGTINNGNADNVSAKIDTGLNGWVQAASINNIGTDIENSLIEAKKLTVGDITNNGGISTRIVEATGTITNNATGLFFVCYIDDPIVTQMHEAASLTAGTIINGGTVSVYSEADLPTPVTVTSIENSGLFEFTGAGFTLTGDIFNKTEGQLDVAGAVTGTTATVTNSGTLNISNADDVSGALTVGAVTNAKTGTINLNAGTTLQGSTVGNAGTITVVSDHATIEGAITNTGTIDALMKKLIVTGDIQNANKDDARIVRNASVIKARELEVTGNVLNYGAIGGESIPVNTMTVSGSLSTYNYLKATILTADSILNDSIQSEVEGEGSRGFIDAGEINAGSVDNVSGIIMTGTSKETGVGINVTGTINNGSAEIVVPAKINVGTNGWIKAASINNIGTDIENSLITAGKITVADIVNNGGFSTRIIENTGTITNNATGLFAVIYIDDPIVTGFVEGASINAGTIINGGTFAVYSEADLPTPVTVTSIENSGLFEFTGVGFTLTGDIFNKTEGQLDVAGTITGGTGSITNSGTLNISNADDVSGVLTIGGAVTNAKTGTINLNAGTTLQGTTIGNAGTITVVSDHATINGAITNHGIIDATKRKLIVVGDLQNANEDDTAEARDNTVITAREFEVTGNVVNYGILGTEMQPDHQIDISGELRNYRQIEVGILTAGSIYSDGYYSEIEEKCTRGYIIAGEVNAGSIDNVSGVIQTAAPKETAVGINVTGTINNGNADGIIAKLNAGINGWLKAATLNNLGNDIENENGLIIAGRLTVGDVTNNGGISTRIVESTGTITNNATGLFSVSYIDDPLVTGMVEAASINAGTIINGGTFAVYSEAELPTEITVTSIENNGLFEFNGAGFTLTGDVVNNANALIDIDGTVSATGTFTNSGTITIDGSLTASSISGGGTITIAVDTADSIAVTADVSGNVIDLEVDLADLTARSYQFVSGTVGEGVTFQVNGTVYKDGDMIDGTDYILTTKGGAGLWLVNDVTNTPDTGWNDYLYNKTDGWNKNIDKFQSNEISSNGEIYLDEKGTIDLEGIHNMFGNDGVNMDKGDVAKISVPQAAKLSFSVKSTAAGTFYIYQVVAGKSKPVTLGKVTVKANQTALLKNICLTADGEYYAAMIAKSVKTAGKLDVYNVNVVDSVFFRDADDGWNSYALNKGVVDNPVSIERGVSSVKLDNTEMIDSDYYRNFVGFGGDSEDGVDRADYAKLNLATTAYLSFDVSTNGNAKFTLWRLDTNDPKNNLKSVTSVTLKSKDGSMVSASTKVQQLEVNDKYEYFISMESKDADKGGSAYYNVDINTVETRFFDSADGHANDWLYDKTKKEYKDDSNFRTNTITGGEQEIILDGNEINDPAFRNYVGYQDPVDYGKIVLTTGGTLTFKITALADVTFEIWQKAEDGKSSPTSLQKKTTVKVKDYSVGTAATKALKLDAGEYYVSVTAKSTKATNKGCAFYNIMATLDTSNASALSMPETDALASALTMPDSLSLGQYDTADVLAGSYLDSASDKLFGESGNGLLA